MRRSNMVAMLELQDSLNKKTCGEKWRSGVTTEGRKIEWLRYTRMEACELIDSSDIYKHWKNLDGAVDWDNMKIEAVDIWHFIMSEIMSNVTKDSAATLICKLLTYDNENSEHLTNSDYENIVVITEELMEATYGRFRGPINEILVYKFNLLLEALKMPVSSLYELYIGKNVLNVFRQDHGYKNGKYSKVINGKEDNVYITEIIKENPDLSFDEIYRRFEVIYNKYVNEFI